LSRFAKKCGFKGYREFVFDYERYLEDANKYCDINELTQKVLSTYQNLLDKSVQLVNEEQMNRIAAFLSQSKRVYVYGMGSSGIAAKEFQWRFMRTGLYVEAITDSHMIKMNAAIVDKDAMVIAISLSGKTKEILAGIHLAKKQGANTIMITGNRDPMLNDICDEVLHVAVLKDLEKGTDVSPQFPILVMVDIFYGYYFNNDKSFIWKKHTQTMSALNQ
jgi:DNA-binding MurR/RpiR family transcriptional regulator